MATFSNETFNSARYQSFRPGYNANFFNMVYNYHAKNGGQFITAVDVGTGTGQVATVLAEKFEHVYGTDASATMLASAVQKPNITYRVGKGEELSWIPDSSVDVVTVAEALHWFDHPKFFAEVKRILKPNGTFATVSYALLQLSDYPRASKRIADLYGEPDQLGTCWEYGRLIVDNMLKCVYVPLKNVERHYFPNHPDGLPPLMGETVSIGHLRNNLKTWSGYKTYCERHPDGEDLIDKTIEDIKREDNLSEEQLVTIHWPTVLILAENNA
ncbi:S-adenosyl-L-methionine-dependent methyltransferase [Mortierella sp. GBAus27b]|nr:hypothetical protein BGX31_008364 [Mortierella sp. GBA43]KAI8355720.1 S-adenosyl-L-methionine-dependent methyltransferase [Mortierella sp. GBAus27b]